MLKFERRGVKYIRTMIFQLLNSLDLFAQVPVFQIMKQKSFTTSIGFLCTIAIVIMCVFQLGINLHELVQRTNPAVVMTDVQQLSSDPVTLFKHNFTLGITVTNSQYSSLKTLNSYFTIKIQNCSRRRRFNETTQKADITQSCYDYDIESCDRDKHFVQQAQKEYFKQFTLSYIYCIKSEQWDERPPVIQGTAVGDDYQYVSISIAACQNTTQSQNCVSQDLIDKQFQTGYYGAYMGDTLAQMNNATNTFQDIVSLQFTSISITNSKQMHQFYKMQKSSTDTGLISTAQQFESSIVLSSNRETQDNYNKKFLILHTFGLDFKATEYRRIYQKVQQILGTVGGLWQVLYLVISICIKPLVLRLMNLEMANKLFSFDINTGADQQQLISQLIMSQQNNNFVQDEVQSFQQGQDSSSINRNISPLPLKSQIKSQRYSVFKPKIQFDFMSKEKLINYIKSRKRNLNLGYQQLFLLFCGCRKKEKKQLDYATQKIMNKLDISYIVTKLFEIDRLKKVLLTQEQQNVFNYLPRPAIPDILFDDQNSNKIRQLEETPQYQYLLEEEQSEVMRLTAAHTAYQSINRSLKISQTNKQLLNLVDNETIQLFQSLDTSLKCEQYDIHYEQQQQMQFQQQQQNQEQPAQEFPVMIIHPPKRR